MKFPDLHHMFHRGTQLFKPLPTLTFSKSVLGECLKEWNVGYYFEKQWNNKLDKYSAPAHLIYSLAKRSRLEFVLSSLTEESRAPADVTSSSFFPSKMFTSLPKMEETVDCRANCLKFLITR